METEEEAKEETGYILLLINLCYADFNYPRDGYGAYT